MLRADVDMHLRTVPEIDHLGVDAGDDIAIRGNLVARTVQGDALRPDDNRGPARLSDAEQTWERGERLVAGGGRIDVD
jgi:hypothetical protein